MLSVAISGLTLLGCRFLHGRSAYGFCPCDTCPLLQLCGFPNSPFATGQKMSAVEIYVHYDLFQIFFVLISFFFLKRAVHTTENCSYVVCCCDNLILPYIYILIFLI